MTDKWVELVKWIDTMSRYNDMCGYDYIKHKMSELEKGEEDSRREYKIKLLDARLYELEHMISSHIDNHDKPKKKKGWFGKND